MEQSSKVNQIKQLFYISNYDECLQKADEMCKQDINFIEYQEIQLYKGLCHFECNNMDKGKETIDRLIDESQIKKGNMVDQIDVIIFALYLAQVFDRDDYEAEQKNPEYLEKLNFYKEQNENLEQYNKGIYFLGLAMYKFIETFRDDDSLECIELLKQSLEIVEDYKQEIMNLVGWMYDYKNQNEESIKWNKNLYELNSKYPGIANNLALCYQQNDNLDEAKEYFKFAEELTPNNTIILINIGVFYQDYDELDKAVFYFKKSYETHPKSDYVCFKYGQYLCSQNEKEEGLKILLQGLENNPKSCSIYAELHKQELKNQNLDKSKYYLQKCTVIQPKNGYYHFRMGEFLLLTQNYEESLIYLKNCLNLKQDKIYSYHALFFIGEIYKGQQEHELSLQYYLMTYNFDPKTDRHMNEASEISFILNSVKQLSEEKKIEMINNQYGEIQMRLSPLIQKQINKKIKSTMQIKQDSFREILTTLIYNNIVKPQLLFQSQHSHLDLYLD